MALPPAGSTTTRSAWPSCYRHDERVATWAGTAHGVLQAVNNYEHHDSLIRGIHRGERNMLRTITGSYSQLDRDTWQHLRAARAG